MLTPEEEEFIRYWEVARTQKQGSVWKLSIGLPLAVFLVVAIFINLLSGWNQRAEMILRSHSSLLITLMLAAIGIVVFITFFSARYRWEQNEQQYRELLARKKAASPDATTSV